jgi:dephospho-CoA kinase
MSAPTGHVRPFRVALTGGIASGKSTVARHFAALGVPVIDTDLIAREVVEPGEPALAEVVAAFGPGVIGADGRLDRRRLREIVFADATARRRLEAILHPAIRARMEAQSAAAGGPYQLLVIPLLAEGGRRDHVDRVLVVDASEATQMERLVRRDGVTRAQAAAALAAQAGRAARLAMADEVIENAGSPEDLGARVMELHERYLQLAAGDR